MRICLFRPDIAGNFGTIVRYLACIGINEIDVIMPTGFTLDSKEFKRSVMDYGSNFEIYKYPTFSDYVKQYYDKRIVLSTTSAEQKYTDFKFLSDDIIMFGSESSGVTEDIKEYCKAKIIIPMQKERRSLNLAISVSVIISEAIRQVYG